MQLARKYRPGTIPAIVEPKIDGVRLFVTLSEMGIAFKSRGGKSWPWLKSRFARDLRLAVKRSGVALPLSLDCELIATSASWGDTMAAINSRKPHKLMIYVFDLVRLVEGSDLRPFIQRRAELEKVLRETPSHIRLIPGVMCYREEAIIEEHDKNLIAGFEGSMIKDPMGDYVSGRRTLKWMKLKPIMDVSGEVKRVDHRGDLIVLLDKSDGGKEVKVSVGLTEEQRVIVRDGVRVNLFSCVSDREQPYVLRRVII